MLHSLWRKTLWTMSDQLSHCTCFSDLEKFIGYTIVSWLTSSSRKWCLGFPKPNLMMKHDHQKCTSRTIYFCRGPSGLTDRLRFQSTPIKSKAIKLNNEILIDENKLIQLNDFGNNRLLKISFGKKKHYIIKFI